MMEDDYARERCLRNIMYVFSVSLPALVTLSIFLHWITGNYRKGYFFLASSCILVSCYFGYYLYRRARNNKAQFWLVSVNPEDWPPFDMPADWLAMLILPVVFLVTIFAT